MPPTTPKKINNWTVQGGSQADSTALKNLFFQETAAGSGQYKLYEVNGQNSTLIITIPATLLGDGQTTSFTFSYAAPGMATVTWTITNFFIGHAGMGTWSNPYGSNDDNGTFVAQAGGTKFDELEEDASAASA